VSGAPPVAFATADPALVEGILRETAVERRLPGPSWTGYVQDLAEAAFEGLVEFIRPFFQRLKPLFGRDLEVPALILLITIGVTLLYVLVRAAVVRVGQGARRPSAARPEVAKATAAATDDRETWRGQLEARLARGEVAPALEALWWWLARSLSGAEASSSWTSRELLASAERPDLLPLTAVLDRMIYGSTPPVPDDVRRLLVRLDEALA